TLPFRDVMALGERGGEMLERDGGLSAALCRRRLWCLCRGLGHRGGLSCCHSEATRCCRFPLDDDGITVCAKEQAFLARGAGNSGPFQLLGLWHGAFAIGLHSNQARTERRNHVRRSL